VTPMPPSVTQQICESVFKFEKFQENVEIRCKLGEIYQQVSYNARALQYFLDEDYKWHKVGVIRISQVGYLKLFVEEPHGFAKRLLNEWSQKFNGHMKKKNSRKIKSKK
jgi:hypothetical protein